MTALVTDGKLSGAKGKQDTTGYYRVVSVLDGYPEKNDHNSCIKVWCCRPGIRFNKSDHWTTTSDDQEPLLGGVFANDVVRYITFTPALLLRAAAAARLHVQHHDRHGELMLALLRGPSASEIRTTKPRNIRSCGEDVE